jgi:peptidoglycan/xylan/chitin deacetylase (PgdA/CDA1 family)
MKRSRFLPVIVVGVVLLAALAAYVFNPYRQIPIHEAIDPRYWILVMKGLDKYDYHNGLLQRGDTSVPEVALTIDDGPDPRYEPAIVQILKQNDIPATFFVIGIRIKQHPELIKLLKDNGFEIGNHTYDHQRLDALKPHEIANELRLCDSHIFAVTGEHPHLMRPPGVQYDDKVLGVAKSMGYVTVSWTVGAKDYEKVSAAFITQRILDKTGNGAIILLHQDNPETAQALPQIITTLKARGYKFVTISQMLNRLNAKLPTVDANSGQ